MAIKKRTTSKQKMASRRNLVKARAAKQLTFGSIIKMGKKHGVNLSSGGNFHFPTEKHWVTISKNVEGIPWVAKESRSKAMITRRKAKSTTKFNPTEKYIRSLFKKALKKNDQYASQS